MIITFNSLCEIHKIIKTEIHNGSLVAFNSLCEILHDPTIQKVFFFLLSILFVRFLSGFGLNRPLMLLPFNSLCEIPNATKNVFRAILGTFNSLCEIPILLFHA